MSRSSFSPALLAAAAAAAPYLAAIPAAPRFAPRQQRPKAKPGEGGPVYGMAVAIARAWIASPPPRPNLEEICTRFATRLDSVACLITSEQRAQADPAIIAARAELTEHARAFLRTHPTNRPAHRRSYRLRHGLNSHAFTAAIGQYQHALAIHAAGYGPAPVRSPRAA